MNQSEIPKTKCPICEYGVDTVTCVDGQNFEKVTPAPGDLTVCFNCANLLVVNDAMGLDVGTTIHKEQARQIGIDFEKLQEIIREKGFPA